MKQELISLNSDTVNRCNFRFHITGLEQSIKDAFERGVPMCIGHDRHRPIGITFPFALYMEPHISRVLGKKLIATNVEDQKQIHKIHESFIHKNYYDGFIPYQDKFLSIIGKYVTENHKRIVAGCAAVYDEGISPKIFPDIFDCKDDDGLIPLSIILADFIYQGQGIFKHRTSDLSIYAHQNFRRSQSIHNNFNFYFLDELLKLASNSDITIKICIDENLVGYAPSFHDSMELEYHWGPKFNNDINSIKRGITRHECDDFERSFYGISRSEFLWKVDDDEKVFEMEELRDRPSPALQQETYNCRYVHSIYKLSTETFRHFDGAIRSYNMDEMADRLDKDFLEYGRKASYKKLFRIDGKLPLEKWKLLVIHYLQGNPLVYEYFGLGEEREMQRLQPREIDKEKELVPFAIEKESGVRLLISYHSLPENLKQGRYIDIYDIMSTATENMNCVEHTIFEIKRALQQLDTDLDVSLGTIFLKIDDRYWNIPSIMHNGPNAMQLLETTIKAYKNLFTSMIKKGYDKDVAFTLAFIINNRLVRVACYGCIEAQLKWMIENLPFKLEEEQFSKWIEKQRTYLEAFPESSDDPLISSLVQFDGVLYIKRNYIKYPYEFVEDKKGLSYKIQLPENKDDEIYNLVRHERVEPKMLIEVKEMTWSDTGQDYFISTRSKWLDPVNDAGVIISKWEPLALYWSKS